MRATIIFTLASLLSCALAAECLLLSATPQWMIAATATALVLCLIFLYIAVVRPMKTIANGMDLLRGQDFSSRLSKVGQPDADRLVEMFNTMMENACAELAPHKVCAYIYDLANAFNRFYHETKILAEENEGRKAGLIALLVLTRDVLETCIDVLGFSAPERM